MDAKNQEIVRTFQEVIPKLTDLQRERLLGIGEGMAMAQRQQEELRKNGEEEKSA